MKVTRFLAVAGAVFAALVLFRATKKTDELPPNIALSTHISNKSEAGPISDQKLTLPLELEKCGKSCCEKEIVEELPEIQEKTPPLEGVQNDFASDGTNSLVTQASFQQFSGKPFPSPQNHQQLERFETIRSEISQSQSTHSADCQCDSHHFGPESMDGACEAGFSDNQRRQKRKVFSRKQSRSPYSKSYPSKAPNNYDEPKLIRPDQFYSYNRPAHQNNTVQPGLGQASILDQASYQANRQFQPSRPVNYWDAISTDELQLQDPNGTSQFNTLNQGTLRIQQADPMAPSVLQKDLPPLPGIQFPQPQSAPVIETVPGRDHLQGSENSAPGWPSQLNSSNQHQPNIQSSRSHSVLGGPTFGGQQQGAPIPVPDPNWTSNQGFHPGFQQNGCDPSIDGSFFKPNGIAPGTTDYFNRNHYYESGTCNDGVSSGFAKRPRRYLAYESQFGQPYFSNGNPGVSTIAGGTTSTQAIEYDVQYANQFLLGFESANGPGFRFDYFDLDAVAERVEATVNGAVSQVSADILSSTNAGDTVAADQRINITNYRPELFKRIYFPISTMTGGFGLEHLTVDQETRFELIPNGASAASNQVHLLRTFRGTGPTFSLDYYRPIGHSRFAIVSGFRGSILFGQDDFQFFHNGHLFNVAKSDRTVTVLGAYLGTEWGQLLGESNKRIFIRGTVGGNSWQSVGVARNDYSDIGWVSFNLTVGLSY